MLAFLALFKKKKKKPQTSTKNHKSQNPRHIFFSRKSSFLISLRSFSGLTSPLGMSVGIIYDPGTLQDSAQGRAPAGRSWDDLASAWTATPGARPQQDRASRELPGEPRSAEPHTPRPAAPAGPSPHRQLLKHLPSFYWRVCHKPRPRRQGHSRVSHGHRTGTLQRRRLSPRAAEPNPLR